MPRLCLLVLAGAMSVASLPALPDGRWWLPLAALAVGLTLAPRSRDLAALLCGALLLWRAADTALASRLDPAQSGNEFTFEAQIIEFPKEESGKLRLTVAPAGGNGLPRRLRLSWYDPPDRPMLGERWRFRARLKRPRGQRNPGGFDVAGWQHRQRIGASGYVRGGQRLEQATARVPRLRRQAVARIESLLPAGDARAALLAIATGARHAIRREAWERYAVTGTSHLMAISGLHVGIAGGVAGLGGWIAAGLAGARGNLRIAAVAFAVPAAGLYALLSGFAIPAQRALLMAALAAACLALRRPVQPAQVLAVAALAVFVADPLVLLAPGFLLSFAAVAVLLRMAACRDRSGHGWSALPRRTWLLCALQAALLLGLFPLTSTLFGRAAWLAPLANLLVVPLFSAVTVPAALTGLLLGGPLSMLGDGLLWLAWYSLQFAHALLAWLAGLPGAVLMLAASGGAGRLLLLLPLLWVLLPAGCPGRGLAWLALAAALAWRPLPVPHGCVDVHVLDVGQGLATVLRTRRHAVVFDTGPSFRGGGDAGASVVRPFLHSLGLEHVDRLIISHADQDHAGGAGSLLQTIPVNQVLAGEPLPFTYRPCRAGQRWRYDGVAFALLHPRDGSTRRGNDASCVLEISAGRARVLLTGDIGAGVERRLARRGLLRPAQLVVVPHHGSGTSSSLALVDALRADTAVVSAGFRNRWGFPKEDVVARWLAAGSRLLLTAHSGAISHRVCRDRMLGPAREYRKIAQRYWHDVP